MTQPDDTIARGEKVHVPPQLASRAYAARKSIAEGFLDLALLLANTSQLRSILEVPNDLRTWTFWPLVVCLGLSLSLQLSCAVILYILGTLETQDDKNEKKIKKLNDASIGLIACITFFNVFVAGFDISFTEQLSTKE